MSRIKVQVRSFAHNTIALSTCLHDEWTVTYVTFWVNLKSNGDERLDVNIYCVTEQSKGWSGKKMAI